MLCNCFSSRIFGCVCYVTVKLYFACVCCKIVLGAVFWLRVL